jgi:hypothetical protein
MVDDTAYPGKDISETSVRSAFSSSLAEGIAGLGAVALAIIGLAHIFPEILVSVATVAIGVALAFEGGAISARYSAMISEPGEKSDVTTQWGGVTALFVGGAAGIALGILSLVGVAPMVLIPVAALVFGSALVLDSGANERLSLMEARHKEGFKVSEHVIRETTHAASGIQVLVGLGSIALGILALIGLVPMVLSLVAMLSIGAANLLTGSMIGARLSRVFH